MVSMPFIPLTGLCEEMKYPGPQKHLVKGFLTQPGVADVLCGVSVAVKVHPLAKAVYPHHSLSSKLVYLSHQLVIPAPVILFNQSFSFVEFFSMLITEMADHAVEAAALKLHL